MVLDVKFIGGKMGGKPPACPTGSRNLQMGGRDNKRMRTAGGWLKTIGRWERIRGGIPPGEDPEARGYRKGGKKGGTRQGGVGLKRGGGGGREKISWDFRWGRGTTRGKNNKNINREIVRCRGAESIGRKDGKISRGKKTTQEDEIQWRTGTRGWATPDNRPATRKKGKDT